MTGRRTTLFRCIRRRAGGAPRGQHIETDFLQRIDGIETGSLSSDTRKWSSGSERSGCTDSWSPPTGPSGLRPATRIDLEKNLPLSAAELRTLLKNRAPWLE
jgi:hypothetical protein